MTFQETSLSGVMLVRFSPKTDERGYFMRIWDMNLAESYGLVSAWVQESVSFSKHKNTLRGLHFQSEPFMETKFITVLRGVIMDVVVDIRPDSPTFGKWESFVLEEDIPSALYIPRGFAHGFKTQSDDCQMLYKMDTPYNSMHESGIIWCDRNLDINWDITDPIISKRDSEFQTFKEYVKNISRTEMV